MQIVMVSLFMRFGENNDCLQQHVQSPHFQNYVQVTDDMVDEFIVTEMTAIS